MYIYKWRFKWIRENKIRLKWVTGRNVIKIMPCKLLAIYLCILKMSSFSRVLCFFFFLSPSSSSSSPRFRFHSNLYAIRDDFGTFLSGTLLYKTRKEVRGITIILRNCLYKGNAVVASRLASYSNTKGGKWYIYILYCDVLGIHYSLFLYISIDVGIRIYVHPSCDVLYVHIYIFHVRLKYM